MASRVGKYLLFETLGEGAFGKVKLGVHEETGEQVAVKIMDKGDIKAQEMTMNVRREIAIMKALKHKNIVNLRCVLTSNTKLYIVMDVVTGGELFTKILNEGKLDEPIARRYFQQLVDGVEYCHRRGVCHRDLKPENLLIDDTTGELKITDFGLSAMRGANTTEELLHTQCGSPNYCAPEIIAHHKEGYNGAKVDAWSCGIILFALLAGYLPFYDENTKVLYRMIQKDEVKFPRRFPLDAKDLVLRLLHKDPDKRISLPDVKKHPWFVIDYQPDTTSVRGPTASSSSSASASADSPHLPSKKPKKSKGAGHSRKPSIDVPPLTVPSRSSDDYAAPESVNSLSSATTLPPVATAAGPAGRSTAAPAYHQVAADPSAMSDTAYAHSNGVVADPTMSGLPSHNTGAPNYPVHQQLSQPTHHHNYALSEQFHQPAPPPPPSPPSMPQHAHSSQPPMSSHAAHAQVPQFSTYFTPPLPPTQQKITTHPPPPHHNPHTPYIHAGVGSFSPPMATSANAAANAAGTAVHAHPGSAAPIGDARGQPYPLYQNLTNVMHDPSSSGAMASQLSHPIPPYIGHQNAPTPSQSAQQMLHMTPHLQHPPPPPPYIPQQPPYPQPQPLSTGTMPMHRTSAHQAARPQATLPPPPTYQMPQAHRSGVNIANPPPPYGAPSPPRISRYPQSQSSSEVTPSSSMDLPTNPVITGSASSRGNLDNVPSYASLVGGASSSLADVQGAPAHVSQFPPAPPFPPADSYPESPDVTSARSPEGTTKAANPGLVDQVVLPSASEHGSVHGKESPGESPSRDPNVNETIGESPRIKSDSAWQNRATLLQPSRGFQKVDADRGHVDLVGNAVESYSDASAAPMSVVQRHRMMFNQLAEKGPAPTPITTSSSSKQSSPAEPRATRENSFTGDSPVRYSDRPEAMPKRRYLPTNGDTGSSVADGGVPMGSASTEKSPAEKRFDALLDLPSVVPMKKRLDAALHRYRRIFQLGNNVGITTSPSFGSKGAGPMPFSNSDADKDSEVNPRAKFFARAKAVTGAWGVILTQELAELDDSDEETQVTETELKAFGRLLDFWDDRRQNASLTGSVVLDDETTVPLSEDDIACIQSLIQKLEPNAVDNVEEVADDDVVVAPQTPVDPTEREHKSEALSLQQSNDDDQSVDMVRIIPATERRNEPAFVEYRDDIPVDDDTRDLIARDFSDLKVNEPDGSSAAAPVLPPPPPPPPPFSMKIAEAGMSNGDAGVPVLSATQLPPPPPPPPPPRLNATAMPHPSVVPPTSEPGGERLFLTDSTLRDPFRPAVPPIAQSPSSTTNHVPPPPPTLPSISAAASPFSVLSPSASPPIGSNSRRRPTVSFDTAEALNNAPALSVGMAVGTAAPAPDASNIPISKSVDADMDRISRRKSSMTGDGPASGRESAERYRPQSVGSTASTVIDESGSRSGREFDLSVAQRGMFGFGVFTRRPAASSFDSGLEPQKCIYEVARILTNMGCSVLVKKGEGKIKCEVPVLRKEKMLVSVTCTRMNGISTISFKRGRRDRSRANENEFQDFVETVSGRFMRQTRGAV